MLMLFLNGGRRVGRAYAVPGGDGRCLGAVRNSGGGGLLPFLGNGAGCGASGWKSALSSRPMKNVAARMPMQAAERAAAGKAFDLKMFFFMVLSSFLALYITYTNLRVAFQQIPKYFLKSCVVEPGQLYVPRNGGVLPPKHPNEEFYIAGKGIFYTAAGDTEPEPDVADGIIIRGERHLVSQAVCHGLFQHGHITAVGIEGVQVFAEVSFPLGAEGVRINACA